MSRHGWRGIFILIIILSLPFYVIGFWILASSPNNDSPTPQPSREVFITQDSPTELPTTAPSATNLEIPTTQVPAQGITRVAPTSIVISTATYTPTIRPTNTLPPTSVPNTASPTPTDQILLPPTNTPPSGG